MKLIPPIAMPAWVAGLKVITSRCESCHRSLALRHLSARKAGIRMHDSWYCSSRCFRSAAEQEILRLLKPRNGAGGSCRAHAAGPEFDQPRFADD